MKKRVILGMLTVLGTVGGVRVHAEEASTEMPVQVESGGISLEAAPGSLDFGAIKTSLDREAYHPTINQRYTMVNEFSWEDSFYNDWMKNPFDNSLHIMPRHVADYWTYVDARAYLVRITDPSTNPGEWKLCAERTPMTHVETGAQMKNERLYFGEFTDNAEVEGEKVDGYSSNGLPDNSYWLADHATLTEEKTVIAAYKGSAAKGKHLISPFKAPNQEGKVLNQPEIRAHEEYSYTEENIILGTDNKTIIPEDGAYTSTITWTVEVTK
ncbi:WxL domain-containing protein [Enterococcus sp. LJL128]|uniref:WxL domain-containing protein n=1 Tax=Enterococcus sp. LJL51 TaxID=3416656 RepID=UPI003CF4B385